MDTTVKYIASAEELLHLELSGRYALDADIDLGGRDWTPLGSDGTPFCGVLDGCGHTISNFRITKTDEAGNTGIFGVNAGTVQLPQSQSGCRGTRRLRSCRCDRGGRCWKNGRRRF